MNLNSLGWKMHDHLKKYRPRMFQALKAEGMLQEHFQTLQQRMGERLDPLENQGLANHEAMEMLREEMFPPAEEDQPTLGKRIQPYRDRPAKKK
jgi:hypothetical protein